VRSAPDRIVLSSSDEKVERAQALGATATINYRRRPRWQEAVLADTATEGDGVGHVIEVIGGEPEPCARGRLSGTISFIGLIAGVMAPIQTYRFVSKNVRLHGVETGSREMFEEMNAFISARGLRPVIDRVVPFTTFPDALHHLKSGAHFGKVVVEF
jgi:NADPH:quinone reductase-like Zn-dependent oxidoreductase